MDIGELYIEPIMEWQGHFHLDKNSEETVAEQVAKITEMILIEMEEKDAPWDEPMELWMVSTKEPVDSHEDRWPSCPLNKDESLTCFDPFRIIKFANIHPADFLSHCFPAPADAGVFLLAEGWALKPEDVDEFETYEEWIGRFDEHPKAQENRQLTYCSPAGEFVIASYFRENKGVVVNTFSEDGDRVDGTIPDALLRFTRNSRPEEMNSWRKSLDIHLSH